MRLAQLLKTALVYLRSATSLFGSKTSASGKATVANRFADDYEAWRNRFFMARLHLALWIGVVFVLTMVALFLGGAFLEPQNFKASYLLSSGVVELCLLTCLMLHRMPLGYRYSGLLFLGFSWSLTVVVQTSVALSGSTTLLQPLWILVFIIQATLISVRWPLHCISQLGAYVCYFAVNAVLGLPMDRPPITYIAISLHLFWVCFVCDLSVYLYERLQRSEFKARRELEIAYQRVEAAEAKYRSIFENAVEGIFQMTPEGRYVTANPALARLYGFDSPEALTKTLTDAQHQLYVDPNRYAEFIDLMQQHGSVAEFEAQIYRQNGSVIWICVNARRVEDKNGAIIYYEGSIEDITERKRAEQALRVFFHAVSHDLRNPILGMLLLLKNLQQQPGETIPLSRMFLERMIQSSDRQLNLINTLLEVHANEVQGVAIHRQPLQLNTLIQEVLADMEPLLTKNQATVINLVPGDLPLVSADATQVWRVIENLVANALKHNPPELTLTLNAEIEDSMVRCDIQDNGVGMHPEQCERLFDLYARSSKTQRSLGLGLGLYICRQIITAHGGKIGVTTSLGAGATFWFTLPLN